MCSCCSKCTENQEDVRTRAEKCLDADIVSFIDECRDKKQPESYLIGILHKVQNRYGYLSRDNLDAVAQLLQVPTAKVTGVASFYHYFRLVPQGQYVVRVCMGTACYVRGAERLADRFQRELGIDFDETTTDQVFSLEASRCLGTCGLAPVVMIGDRIHGHLTPDQVPGLLEQYFKAARNTE